MNEEWLIARKSPPLSAELKCPSASFAASAGQSSRPSRQQL